MNDWITIQQTAIVEADDFQDRYDRNGLNFLFYWKTKYPDFKITLFTIPDRTSKELLELMVKHKDWIELAVHGWNHESNFECWSWDTQRVDALVDRLNRIGHYVKIFKAPGWMITGTQTGEGSGYKPNPELPVGQNHQTVYNALQRHEITVVDRHYNHNLRPSQEKIICIDCQTNFVHMHTWDMETGDKNGRNGFRQVEEEHGVPWDRNTKFYFISEAIEKGLVQPCKR